MMSAWYEEAEEQDYDGKKVATLDGEGSVARPFDDTFRSAPEQE